MGKPKPVVIVESPTKVKTINKILGDGYRVFSSMGHLIDLPKSTLGVDIKNNFEPKFIIVRSKQKILSQLKKDTEKAEEIYVATDPDREGEAIGWNIAHEIADNKKVHRVTFQEITKEAVLKAFQNKRQFDKRLVDAQVARRILDRIVGYKISPLLWRKVGSHLSAGRVQSVALRIIVEREREIKRFQPKEYWQISVDLKKKNFNQLVEASLEKINNEKFELGSKKETDPIVEEIKKESFIVTDISTRQVRRNPNPPFITSTLQQEAFNKLRFNASKTMMIAQELYEGVDIGDGETVGLITYMRTDSVSVSQEAINKVRAFITSTYGEKYLPETPPVYKSRKSAQEAHEAIRPTDIFRRPQDIQEYLEPTQYKLYELIWRRFVSSQMMPAVYEQKKMEIKAGRFQFGASGSTLIFDGYLTIDKEAKEEEKKVDFSRFQKDGRLTLIHVNPTQHFTKPPPRYSDASLVKALEEDGIGRPSTYAAIIQTLVLRNYVIREKGYMTPTELGFKICDLLVEYFSKVMDVGFTAQMEESLDLIEEGKKEYHQLLDEFYQPFQEELAYAEKNIEKTETYVDRQCQECGRQMVIKWGRRGKFLSCSGFPKCKYSEAVTSGVKCPQPGCGGELVSRRSRRGSFYGCTHYPQCTYVTNELPQEVK